MLPRIVGSITRLPGRPQAKPPERRRLVCREFLSRKTLSSVSDSSDGVLYYCIPVLHVGTRVSTHVNVPEAWVGGECIIHRIRRWNEKSTNVPLIEKIEIIPRIVISQGNDTTARKGNRAMKTKEECLQ